MVDRTKVEALKRSPVDDSLTVELHICCIDTHINRLPHYLVYKRTHERDLLHVASRPISCSREIAGEREPDVVV